jgi:ATP-dependent Clp protease ATP-binding subunit ClpC
VFERFTDAGRRSVVLAQESARSLGHGSITVVHLMLGVTRVLEDTGDDVLEARGVTQEQLRGAVAKVLPAEPVDPAAEGHVPFSAGAKKTLELSLRESLDRGHNEIQPRHLLLAVLGNPDDDLDTVLTSAGLSAESLRADVERAMPAVTAAPQPFFRAGEGRRLERIETLLTDVLARLERIERRLDRS